MRIDFVAVSDGFGFGVLDAKALTDGARNWTNVGPQLNCTVSYAENAKYAMGVQFAVHLLVCNV